MAAANQMIKDNKFGLEMGLLTTETSEGILAFVVSTFKRYNKLIHESFTRCVFDR